MNFQRFNKTKIPIYLVAVIIILSFLLSVFYGVALPVIAPHLKNADFVDILSNTKQNMSIVPFKIGKDQNVDNTTYDWIYCNKYTALSRIKSFLLIRGLIPDQRKFKFLLKNDSSDLNGLVICAADACIIQRSDRSYLIVCYKRIQEDTITTCAKNDTFMDEMRSVFTPQDAGMYFAVYEMSLPVPNELPEASVLREMSSFKTYTEKNRMDAVTINIIKSRLFYYGMILVIVLIVCCLFAKTKGITDIKKRDSTY